MSKNFTVSIPYRNDNASSVERLVSAFEKAGKIKITGAAESFLNYERDATVCDGKPFTFGDIQQLRSLGGQVSFHGR